MQLQRSAIPAGQWLFPETETVDLFDAWVFAAADAGRAYDSWNDADAQDSHDTFVVYRAALDREEAAAKVLAEHLAPAR